MSDLPRDRRSASVARNTAETRISLTFCLDGAGGGTRATGVGFLDHMLDLFARHGQFDLDVTCAGDLQVDDHHSVEDVGIALGMAFHEALGDKAFINRYGHAYVPMDEALARAVVDLSGRFYLHFSAGFTRERVGDLSTELVRHFWYSFAEQARMNLHIDLLQGDNAHHQIEAIFKAVARALRAAVRREDGNARMPSTKGVL
ncbi:MAG: imidazoleglycerol-phosphate dehydratase HisB [Rhodothermales bacterium]